MITNIHMFFTLYVIALLVFHKHTSRYVDLLLLSVVVFVVGCYLSFIEPRKYVFTIAGNTYELSGLTRLLIVDLTHTLILIFAIYVTMGQTLSMYQLGLTLLILVTYVVLVDVQRIYLVPKTTLFALGLGVCVLYSSLVVLSEKLI